MLNDVLKHQSFKETILGNSSQNNQKLERAKQYPIEKLYNGELKKTGGVLLGKCPFHQDDKPSFAIYTATNTWNCFGKQGCGGGDSITYLIKQKGITFQEAIEELSR